MTTGLSGEPELEVEEADFPWDEFAPDEDDADLEVTEYDLVDELLADDSDLDWEAAMEAEDNPTADTHTNAEAALERIEDSVRRTWGPSPEAEAQAQAEAEARAAAE